MDKLLYRAFLTYSYRIHNNFFFIQIYTYDRIHSFLFFIPYKEKIPTLTYKYPRDVLALQYIGTDDINKKKIFEADIVRWKKFEEYYSLESFIRNDYITGVVVWSEEECCFKVEQITEGMNIFKLEDFLSENSTKFYDEEGQQVFDWNSVEIIGNRFDDPDLLKSDDEKKEKGE